MAILTCELFFLARQLCVFVAVAMETGGCRAEVAAPTPPLRVAARTSSTGNEGAVTPVAARRFKTTHTCGSLFANCGCSRFQRNHADDKKRSSSPSVNYSRYRSHEKRLSNPEVSLVEPAEEVTPSQLLLPLIRPKYKRSQTQSESSEDIARKFLQDFGILGPMGNGVTLHRKVSLDAAHKRVVPDTPAKDQLTQTIPSDYEYLKNIVPKLEKDLRDLEIKNGTLNSELQTTRKELQIKDSAVLKYQREVHKLKVHIFIYYYRHLRTKLRRKQ